MASVLYLHVRPDAREVYGGEKSCLATAAGVTTAGFLPRFMITGHDDFAEQTRAKGVPVDIVDVRNPLVGFRAAPWRAKVRRLAQIREVNRAVYRIAKMTGSEIVHLNELPAFVCGWAGAFAAGAKTVMHVRGSNAHDVRWIEMIAMLASSMTITVSESLRTELLEGISTWLQPFFRDRIRAIANGFEFERIDNFILEMTNAEARACLGIAPDAFVVLVVGFIGPVKGQLAFLREALPAVVRSQPTTVVLCVGGVKDGGYMRQCQDTIDHDGLARHVTFAGYHDSQGVFTAYRAADVLVSSSVREGLPRAIIEGQAFGLPVVATEITGSIDIIVPGVTGFLVPPSEVAEMSGPIIRLAQDAQLRSRMGALGSERVRRCYGLDKNVREIASLYRELIGGVREAVCDKVDELARCSASSAPVRENLTV